jgi:hypothetical protein
VLARERDERASVRLRHQAFIERAHRQHHVHVRHATRLVLPHPQRHRPTLETTLRRVSRCRLSRTLIQTTPLNRRLLIPLRRHQRINTTAKHPAVRVLTQPAAVLFIPRQHTRTRRRHRHDPRGTHQLSVTQRLHPQVHRPLRTTRRTPPRPTTHLHHPTPTTISTIGGFLLLV